MYNPLIGTPQTLDAEKKKKKKKKKKKRQCHPGGSYQPRPQDRAMQSTKGFKRLSVVYVPPFEDETGVFPAFVGSRVAKKLGAHPPPPPPV
jgi:hypothetical protein